jgi:molybdate/tungstate transport system substrate-binding protein
MQLWGKIEMYRRLGRSGYCLMVLALLLFSCGNPGNKNAGNKVLSVFHAGSLSVPMKNLAAAFEKENPGVIVRLEAAGSLTCVRKVTELKQFCDVLALADFNLIDEWLIPGYADWNILFATNELCIVYTDKSTKANLINSGNWYQLLMDPGIRYGRSDPNSDPCGYRTVMALKLAGKLYPGGMDWQRLLDKDTRFIRGKETDLNALLESRTIDYMFNYRSVAVQHDFKYLVLPDSINLSDPQLESWYSTAEVEVRGTSPGTVITQKGSPIVYGMTVLKKAANPDLAEKFIRFVLNPEKGRVIIRQSGQKAIIPGYSPKSKTERLLF